jgi:hypothetical protein
MRAHSFLQTLVCATLTSIVLAAVGSVAKAQDLPSYMAPISGRTASSPAETATKNVLALNTGMFELGEREQLIWKLEVEPFEGLMASSNFVGCEGPRRTVTTQYPSGTVQPGGVGLRRPGV